MSKLKFVIAVRYCNCCYAGGWSVLNAVNNTENNPVDVVLPCTPYHTAYFTSETSPLDMYLP